MGREDFWSIIQREIFGGQDEALKALSEQYYRNIDQLHRELKAYLKASSATVLEYSQMRVELELILQRRTQQIARDGMSSIQDGWLRGTADVERLFNVMEVDHLFQIGLTGFEQQALQSLTFDRIVQVTPEMVNAIQAQVQATIFSGQSAWEAMKGITEIVGIRPIKDYHEVGHGSGISYKAERILRTELMTAENTAAELAMEKARADFPDLKEAWLSTGDFRTRNTHLAIHGQVKEPGGSFLVGGWPAQYPLDPGLPIHERANCRCRHIPYREAWGSLQELTGPLDDKVATELNRRGMATGMDVKHLSVGNALKDRAGDYDSLREKLFKNRSFKTANANVGKQQLKVEGLRAQHRGLQAKTQHLRTSPGYSFSAPSAEMSALIEEMNGIAQLYEEALAILDELAAKQGRVISKVLGLPKGEQAVLSRSTSIQTLQQYVSAMRASPAAQAERKLVKRVIKNSVDFTRSMTSAEAFESQAIRKVKFKYRPTNSRAYASWDEIYLFRQDFADAGIHELGHHLEKWNSHFHDRTIEFLNYRRLPGERQVMLNRLPGLEALNASELTYKDKWKHPYMGKIYETSAGVQHGTELLSMGMQELYMDPVAFYNADPEHFNFVIGLLRGWL